MQAVHLFSVSTRHVIVHYQRQVDLHLQVAMHVRLKLEVLLFFLYICHEIRVHACTQIMTL